MRVATVIPVSEATQAGAARRAVMRLAGTLGMNEEDAGRAALVASEAASNLAKHARHGELLCQPLVWNDSSGVEILSLDKGPGMNVAESMRDGHSSAGTSGTGLGAMRRVSDAFEMYSAPPGTAVVAQVWKRARPAVRQAIEIGCVSVAHPAETTCGDTWAVRYEPSRVTLMVADGSGHGPLAAEAANEAARIFQQGPDGREPGEVLEYAHLALRKTRGAAVGVVEFNLVRREIRFAAVGNISGSILSPGGSRSMVYHNGTLGHSVLRIQEFTYDWPPGAVVVMHSDGLATWSVDKYPGLLARHPALIAGVLYRDYRRIRDDATVLVARDAPARWAA